MADGYADLDETALLDRDAADRVPEPHATGLRRARVVGFGAALPERCVTNAELATQLGITEDWIVQRSGIRERRYAADGQFTSDLAIAAARQALDRAGLAGAALDLVILATTTPDNTTPGTAVKVQAALGMTAGAAFDIQAACSGFVFALSMADSLIKSGQMQRILVIGADTLSRFLDWQDPNSCILFGDGAGAVVLQAEAAESGKAGRGVLSTHLHSDGRHYNKISTDGGVSTTRTVGQLHLDGRAVFLHAVSNLAAVSREALAANGLTGEALDWLVPHQANQRIIETVAQKVAVPAEKVVLTLAEHGNTSAASIPLALDRCGSDGRLKAGDLVLTPAMGAGLTWGAALIRW